MVTPAPKSAGIPRWPARRVDGRSASTLPGPLVDPASAHRQAFQPQAQRTGRLT